MTRYMFALILMSAIHGTTYAGPIDLIHDGTSDHVIFYESTAAKTVAEAAKDLQTYLERASGAKLPIVHQPTPNMISLGDNPASRKAGLSVAEIPPEGFRIVTKDENIFLIGSDSADSQRTDGGGTLQRGLRVP